MVEALKPLRVDKSVLENKIVYKFVFNDYVTVKNYRKVFCEKLGGNLRYNNLYFYVSSIYTKENSDTKKLEYIFNFHFNEGMILETNSLAMTHVSELHAK